MAKVAKCEHCRGRGGRVGGRGRRERSRECAMSALSALSKVIACFSFSAAIIFLCSRLSNRTVINSRNSCNKIIFEIELFRAFVSGSFLPRAIATHAM